MSPGTNLALIELNDPHLEHDFQLKRAAAIVSKRVRIDKVNILSCCFVLGCTKCHEDLDERVRESGLEIDENHSSICLLIDEVLGFVSQGNLLPPQAREIIARHVMNCSRCKPIHYGS